MTTAKTILRCQLALVPLIAALKVLSAEEADGMRLSNVNLGRRLRARGYVVANDKLAAIGKAARARLDGAQP